MHVDDYQRTANRGAAGKGDKVNVQQILADPKQLQVCSQQPITYLELFPSYFPSLRELSEGASYLRHQIRTV